MPRINVYVPKELKEKMEERSDINWSRVFQDCAEALLEAYPKRDILYLASKDFGRRH